LQIDTREIHQRAGEALDLSQAFEALLSSLLIMLFMLENGLQRDISPEELLDQTQRAEEYGTHIKRRSMARFRSDSQIKRTELLMLVRNGTMGDLKRALSAKLNISANGPSHYWPEFEQALEARNYLCHRFFDELNESSAKFDPLKKLDEILKKLEKACDRGVQIQQALIEQFPKTFIRSSYASSSSIN
jgi:hypothetical protein